MQSKGALVCVAMLAGLVAYGQATGTVTGVVTDASGAVLTGAKITLRNTDTASTYQADTTATGNYTVEQLPPGSYDLKVEAMGFKQFNRKAIGVELSHVLRVDVAMQVGSASDSVTVTAETPILDTENSATVYNVTFDELANIPILPVNGSGTANTAGYRDPYALLKTVAGTRYLGDNGGIPGNGLVTNGLTGQNNILIEGMSGQQTNGDSFLTQIAQPSSDAIQEVAVLTSNYSAEYGTVGGTMLNVTMRSGTNQYHGSAYAYGINEALNAAQPFTGLKNVERRYNFGGTIGGPVRIPKVYNGKNKTFFFFNWEQYLENSQINTTSDTVPIDAYRQGNFSGLIGDYNNQYVTQGSGKNVTNWVDPLGNNVLQGAIFDPLSGYQVTCNKTVVPTASCTTGSVYTERTQFANNSIDPSRFDKVSLNLLKLVPEPQGPNFQQGQIANNYQHGFPDEMHSYIPSVKIDHLINSKNHLSLYWQNTRYHSPFIYPNGGATGLPEPLDPGRGTASNTNVARITYDLTVTPTLLVHLGAGFNNETILVEPPVTNYDAEAGLGITGLTVKKLFPNINVGSATATGGMSNLGNGTLSSGGSEQTPEAQASVTWVHGNHTVKAGWDWRYELSPTNSFSGTNGNFTFDTNPTLQTALQGFTVGGSTGFAFASFLMGAVSTVSLQAPTDYRDQKIQTSLYLQDTWKVTRRLSLDYGLRYDYGTFTEEQYGREAAFNATVPNPSAGNHPGGAIYEATCHCAFSRNYPFALGPRIGVAYHLGQNNVLRGGVGLVYAPTNYAVGAIIQPASTSGAPAYGQYYSQFQNGIPATINPSWPVFTAAGSLLPGTVGGAPPALGPGAGRPSRTYQWSIGIQRAVTRSLVLEATYVGNEAVWLSAGGLSTLNLMSQQQLAADGFTLGNTTDAGILNGTYSAAAASASSKATLAARGIGLPYAGFPTTQTVRQSLLSFPQYTSIGQTNALGKSWYDALQLTATQRLYHGLTLTANYSYSKNLSLQGSPDPFNPRLGKNYSGLDLPHQFRLSGYYTIPVQRSGFFGHNKIVSEIVSGWQVGAYLQYQSAAILGEPNSVYTTTPIGNWLGYGNAPAQWNGTELWSTNWTDYSGKVHSTPIDINCHCFDPRENVLLNAAAWSPAPSGAFAPQVNNNTIRNFRGFRYPQENGNFGRNFRIKEKVTMQVRVEWTNIFNRLDWAAAALNTTAPGGYQNTPSKTGGVYSQGYGIVTVGANGVGGQRSGQMIVRLNF